MLDLPTYLTMFEVTPKPGNRTDKFVVDTSALRAKHDVSFIHGDLVNDSLDIPEADVIFCNNLLFHLNAEDAEQLVESMAKHLAVGGVLSFGANPKQVRMSGNHDGTDYPDWRRRMATKLSEIGIEPILYDTARKAPFVFKRVRSVEAK